MNCFWAYPEDYDHVANMKQKVITIVFTGDETEDFNKLVEQSGIDGAQEMIKRILHEYLERNNSTILHK